MIQKQRVTSELIIEVAFDILRRDGMDSIDVRSIAREAHCSTQLVFSYFKTLNIIKDEVEQRTVTSFKNVLEPSLEAIHPLKEACRTYIRFAKEEPKLFQHLFIRTKLGPDLLFGGEQFYSKLQAAVEKKDGLQPKQVKELMNLICPYAHGMAVIQATSEAQLPEDQLFSKLSMMIDAVQESLCLGL